MSAFDFDEVLEGVLREDAQVEPRRGLEARVLGRVLNKRRSLSRKWIPWTAVTASAFVVGVFVWIGPVMKLHLEGASSPLTLSRAAPMHDVVMRDRGAAPGRTPTANSVCTTRAETLRIVKRSQTILQEEPLQVAPIEITPLRIEPIEIASLITKDER